MISIDELKFDSNGLIPAVLVDDATGKVLMVAWMNEESLKATIERKLACFWSRSRQELWVKGETSGNYQHVVSITADCDADTLLVRVNPDGPACHLGTESCFEQPLFIAEAKTPAGGPEIASEAAGAEELASTSEWSLEGLMELLKGRRENPKEGSYTNYLFDKGIDKILKKVGEESTEVIIAAHANDRAETIYEISDLVYHVLVLMVEQGIEIDDIRAELASRHVIDHKVKQEKMTS